MKVSIINLGIINENNDGNNNNVNYDEDLKLKDLPPREPERSIKHLEERKK